jgi:hypothetical protein
VLRKLGRIDEARKEWTKVLGMDNAELKAVAQKDLDKYKGK